MSTFLSLLVAPKIVAMPTADAANGDNVSITTTFSFHWLNWDWHYFNAVDNIGQGIVSISDKTSYWEISHLVSNTRDLVLNVHIALKFDRRIASMLSSRLSNFWAIGRLKTPMSHLRYFAICIRRLMSNRNNYLIPAQFWPTQYRLFTCNKCYE